MLRNLVTCLALVLAAGTARAGIDNAGTTAGNFLSVGTGASVLAMGGATLGTGDDLHAAAWNPAALARLGATQFALSHATLAELSAQDLAAAGGRVGNGATRWGASLLYQGDGSFDGRDALGGSTGSFNVSSMAFGIQLAQPLGDALSAGVGARWLSDNLADARGSGLAVDLGLQARTGPFGLGVAARNVGGSMSYASGRFELPAVYGVGTSWNDASHGLRLALDANFPHAYYNDVRFGGEWRWQDRVALRAGYRMELGATSGEPLGGPSFGIGAGASGVWMDYAFLAGNADAQGQHRLGLTFRPGFLGGMPRPVAGARPAEVRTAGTIGPRARTAQARYAGTPVTVALVTEAVAGDAPAAPAPAADQQAPAPPETAPAAETPAPVAPAIAPSPASASAPLAFDVSNRLPPGGTESEVYPRELVPLYALVPSPQVPVAPLVITKATDSGEADLAEEQTVVAPHVAVPHSAVLHAAAAPVAAARVTAPRTAAARPAAPPVAAVSAPAPHVAASPVAAAPAAAPPIAARPAAPRPVATRSAAARPAVTPVSAAPVAAAARAVAAPAPAPPAKATVLAVNHPVRPARVPRAAPAPKPAVPPVTAPDSAPESGVTPAGPQDAPAPPAVPAAPAAPASTPESSRPAKTSPWPSVSAALPNAKLAGSSRKVVVVTVPASAPSTAPITRSAPSEPRPEFVQVGGDETLADLAKRWDTSVPALMMENNLVNSAVKHGQRIKLPPPLHP